MKVGFFQFDVGRSRDKNLEHIANKLAGKSFDLMVLPELFTSGYSFDKQEDILPYLESLSNSTTINSLQAIAHACRGAITGTIPELYNGNVYNTAILVDAKGLVAYQRKIHLPDYEKRIFTAGKRIEVAQLPLTEGGEATVGMMICFDCWFAPFSSSLKNQGAQVVCHSSCFGGEVTPTIVPIRALENQNFVVSCNRVGVELFDGEEESYRGESQIVDPDGKIIYKAGNGEELFITDIDLTQVNHPDFGSLITQDFASEHHKYKIDIR